MLRTDTKVALTALGLPSGSSVLLRLGGVFAGMTSNLISVSLAGSQRNTDRFLPRVSFEQSRRRHG
jgi:hypothetical protein